MTADGRVKLSLAFSAVVAGIGVYFNFYDSITLSLFISAIGLVAVLRNAKAAILAMSLVAVGLFWSSLDDDGCSLWFRARLISAKAQGDLADVPWREVWAYAGSFSHCYSTYRPRKIEEKVVDGATIELYEAGGDRFWIGAGGRPLLISLLTEVFHGEDYEHARVKISPGDTVVDAGAHNRRFHEIRAPPGGRQGHRDRTRPDKRRMFQGQFGGRDTGRQRHSSRSRSMARRVRARIRPEHKQFRREQLHSAGD